MKHINRNLRIESFYYDLPEHRIAEFPLPERDASKLLVYQSGKIREERFSSLASHLPEDALLVVNTTRVIEARILFKKETGAFIEIFCLEHFEKSPEAAMQEKESATWKCLIGGASKWKPGQVLHKELNAGLTLEARFLAKEEDYFLITFSWSPVELSFAEIIEAAGAIPLPPYIKRKAETSDSERYQTIFAREKGSVAAPTAALHFTPAVFSSLAEKNIQPAYITLHVGAGTFKPVKSETIAGHPMHGEPFSVDRKTILSLLNSKQTIAVGTTSLRTLESLYWLGVNIKNSRKTNELSQWECYELAEAHEEISKEESLRNILAWMEANQTEIFYARTSLIIIPGYQFRMADALVTNFHQPKSTLLLLVAAFIGDDWKRVYDYALEHDFRFLSYGDSSLLWRKDQVSSRL